MTTLSTIADALEFVVERNTFHSKIIIGIATLFGVSGVILLSRAFSTQGPQRMVMLVGGGLLIVTILFLYERIQNLRKQNLVMEMVVAIISRIQDEATYCRGVLHAMLVRSRTTEYAQKLTPN